MEKDAISYLEGYQEGKKVGIKEVVEWISANLEEVECLFEERIGEIAVDYDDWQAKLKDWGI